MPETNKHLGKLYEKGDSFWKKYLLLIRSPGFVGYSLCAGLSFAGFLVYYQMSPFLFEERLGFTPFHYSLLSIYVFAAYMLGTGFVAIFAKAYMLGTGFVAIFAKRIGNPGMVLVGNALMFIAGIILLVAIFSFSLSETVLLIPVVIYIIGFRLVLPSATAGALTPFPGMSGTAAALLGTIMSTIVAIISYLAALLPETNPLYLAFIFIMVLNQYSALKFWHVCARESIGELP